MSPRVYITAGITLLLGVFCYWHVDIPVMQYFEAHRAWFPVADSISYIGRYYDIGIGLILAGWFWRYRRSAVRRQQALFFTVCWAGSNIAGALFKYLFGRYRPKMWVSDGLYGFHGFGTRHALSSFPSGHTLDAVAIAAALWILWPRSRPWCVAWAIAMGLARIIVRAHYVSDVLAGALLGFLCVYFIRKWLNPARDTNIPADSNIPA
jgi:membrane-associated phospholipid phosphatase